MNKMAAIGELPLVSDPLILISFLFFFLDLFDYFQILNSYSN